MKKTILTLLSLLSFYTVDAEEVLINGINYQVINDKHEARVISLPLGNKYCGNIDIPDSILYNGVYYNVTSIGTRAFRESKDLISVNIPYSVNIIEAWSFEECSGLTSVRIPNSVNTIDECAFRNCISLTSIMIEDVKIIGSCAFSGCSSLKTLTIPESVILFDISSIFDCCNLSDLYLLTNKFPEWIAWGKTVDYWLWYDSQQLKNITLHLKDKVASSYNSQIPWCDFKYIVWEKNTDFILTYYVDGVLYKEDKYKYEDVVIPEQVPIKKGYLFSGWINLPEIMPAENIDVYGYFSILKDTINNVVYAAADNDKNYATVIGNYFAGDEVKMVSELVLGDYCYKVTSISDSAFYECRNITSIELGKYINHIGERAFANIDKLNDVYIKATEIPQTNRTAFENSYIDYVTLHVPASALDNYRNTAPWSGFKEFVSIEEAEPQEKCATPTIEYRGGKLLVSCLTDGSECVTTITSADVDTHYGNEVAISYTYNISTYAKAEGYENSEVATAMLIWIENEDISTRINEEIKAKPVLIQSQNGFLIINGAEQGTALEVYTISGQQIASHIAQTGTTIIATTLKSGTVAIVKIGDRSFKIVIR